MRHAAISILLLLPLLAVGACSSDEEGDGSLKVVLSHGANSRPYLPWPRDVAKQVAGDLEDVGFTVEIRPEPWSAYIPTVTNGRHQLALLGWSPDLPDTDNYLVPLLHSDSSEIGSANNISFYRNEAFDALLDEARLPHTREERAALYEKALRMVFRDVPMVPLIYADRRIAFRKGLAPLQVEWVTHPLIRRVTEAPSDTLVFLRGADSNSLDPGDVTDGESSKVIEQVFDRLVRYVPGTQDVEPALATSWSQSDDHKVWTFQIREGVTFHDGSALDGAAVATTFERMRDPNHPYHFPDGKWDNWKGSFQRLIGKVEVGSHPMEVVFRCNHAAPSFFLHMLAMFGCSIISPAALEKHGADIRINPVGTGAFKFVKWDSGREIHLTRNDDYWDGAPKLKDVYFRISQDATVRADRLIAGSGADLIDNLGPDTIPQLEQTESVVVSKLPQSSFCYLSMNCLKPPFDNPKVREAVAYALNKENLIKLAYRGYAKPALVPTLPSFVGFPKDLEDRPHDPEKAKALLREAGYDVK